MIIAPAACSSNGPGVLNGALPGAPSDPNQELANAIPCPASTSEEQALCTAYRELKAAGFAVTFQDPQTVQKMQSYACREYPVDMPADASAEDKKAFNEYMANFAESVRSGRLSIAVRELDITGNEAVVWEDQWFPVEDGSEFDDSPVRDGKRLSAGAYRWVKEDGTWKQCDDGHQVPRSRQPSLPPAPPR